METDRDTPGPMRSTTPVTARNSPLVQSVLSISNADFIRQQRKLSVAVRSRNKKTILKLCKAGAATTTGTYDLWTYIANNGQLQIAQYLLEHGTIICEHNLFPVVAANKISMVHLLLKSSNEFYIDNPGQQEHDHHGELRRSNRFGTTLGIVIPWFKMLKMAIQNKSHDIFLLLLLSATSRLYNLDSDSLGRCRELLTELLVEAAKQDAIQIAERLIDLGADIEGTHEPGGCPLQLAATNDRKGMSNMLIRHGASLTDQIVINLVRNNRYSLLTAIILYRNGLNSKNSDHQSQSSLELVDSADPACRSGTDNDNNYTCRRIIEEAVYSWQGYNISEALMHHRSRLLANLNSKDTAIATFNTTRQTCSDASTTISTQEQYPIVPTLDHDAKFKKFLARVSNVFRARQWLQKCITGHEVCRLTERKLPQLPKRVIFIDSTDVKAIPRLIEVQDHKGYYCTLSYRWRPQEEFISTTATLEQNKIRIDMHRAPPTIQAAIEICRHLLVEYLWVDALCIIQDSHSDKQEEMARMARTYNSALLNIAIPYDLEESHGKSRHHNLMSEDSIHSRGWIIQEQMLSRRQLVLADNSLSWECITHRADEQAPLGIPAHLEPTYRHRDQRTFKEVINLSFTASSTASVQFTLHRAWYNLVEDYSARNLTNQADKALAISGIAQRIAQVLRDKYLAGLWQGTLLQDLCWRVNHPDPDEYNEVMDMSANLDNKSPDPADKSAGSGLDMQTAQPNESFAVFSAPSWSWLSSRQSVKCLGEVRSQSCVNNSIISVDVRTTAPSILSYQISGSLTLKGFMQTCRHFAEAFDDAARSGGKIIEHDPIQSWIESFWVLDNGDQLPPEDAWLFITGDMPVYLILEESHNPPNSDHEGVVIVWKRIGIADFPVDFRFKEAFGGQEDQIISII